MFVSPHFDLWARWPIGLDLGHYASRGYNGIVLPNVVQSAVKTALGKGDTSAMYLQLLKFPPVLVSKNAQFCLENICVGYGVGICRPYEFLFCFVAVPGELYQSGE
jgi:hypothetical protein